MKSQLIRAKPPFFFIGIIFALSILTSNGQQISTVAEIYNYDVGDIFHVREFGSANGGGFVKNYSFEITSKNYFVNNDSLIYTRYIKTAESSSDNPDWVFDNYYDTVIYYNLDYLINEGDIDTVYSDIDLYNGRFINSKDYSTEYIHERYEFIEGCGGHYRWYEDIENYFYYQYELKYFKKGNEEWGEQLMVLTGPSLTINTKSYAYPNPFHSILKIDLTNSNSKECQGFIFNICGNQIINIPLKANQLNVIDLYDLPKGLYILQINGNTVHNQLILKQ